MGAVSTGASGAVKAAKGRIRLMGSSARMQQTRETSDGYPVWSPVPGSVVNKPATLELPMNAPLTFNQAMFSLADGWLLYWFYCSNWFCRPAFGIVCGSYLWQLKFGIYICVAFKIMFWLPVPTSLCHIFTVLEQRGLNV